MKKVLLWAVSVALLLGSFVSAPVLAGGLPKYISIPQFCGETRIVHWEARWVPSKKNPNPFTVWSYGDLVKNEPIILTEDHVHVVTRWGGGAVVLIPQDVQIRYLFITVDNKNGDHGYLFEIRDGKIDEQANRIVCKK